MLPSPGCMLHMLCIILLGRLAFLQCIRMIKSALSSPDNYWSDFFCCRCLMLTWSVVKRAVPVKAWRPHLGVWAGVYRRAAPAPFWGEWGLSRQQKWLFVGRYCCLLVVLPLLGVVLRRKGIAQHSYSTASRWGQPCLDSGAGARHGTSTCAKTTVKATRALFYTSAYSVGSALQDCWLGRAEESRLINWFCQTVETSFWLFRRQKIASKPGTCHSGRTSMGQSVLHDI